MLSTHAHLHTAKQGLFHFYVYLATKFLSLTGDGVLTLPPVDDDSFPITLPQPLPLGSVQNVTTYATAYVS